MLSAGMPQPQLPETLQAIRLPIVQGPRRDEIHEAWLQVPLQKGHCPVER